MNDNLISVIDAAKKLGVQRQRLFKVIKKLGIATTKERSQNHRGQAIAYIKDADLDLIINSSAMDSTETVTNGERPSMVLDHGVFYLVQLEPEHDPLRFKVGFASNMSDRLRSLRCSAPFALILDTWPCHRLWEKTAIDCITHGCEKLHTEVFRTDDISRVKDKCHQFFHLMPNLQTEA